MQLTEQITFGVKQNQDDMTKVLRESAVALQSSIADIRNLLLETTQSANTQLNDHMRALSDKTSEQIVKLDVALENELSKSISSLGRQLTALSKQFVEDYSPLTERLRAVVQGPLSATQTGEVVMPKEVVKPGAKVPDSGIYRDSSSGERATLVRGKTAPPTDKPGGKWREVVDTNPTDRSSRR